MNTARRFEAYMEHLAAGLGHADRHAGLKDYCTGLMLPLERKSIEPIAASVDPLHVGARHQSLHHFVAKAQWSDEQMLRRIRQWVMPKMGLEAGGFWIMDDTGFPKKGRHSVGVARQYCGALGKQDNCQVAVSVSLASEAASLPVSWQLYLPKDWAQDAARRDKAGVPEAIGFATKPQIALQHLEHLLAEGLPHHCVLADAGYGVDTAFRQGLSALGLMYMVGITCAVSVWPPDIEPLPPKPYRGHGRPRRTARRQPVPVKALAMALPEQAFHTVCWRQGTNQPLESRFAAVRVRHAGGNVGRARLWPQQWLLIQWPQDQPEPEKYYLSTLPETHTLSELVQVAHQRWRIERDYQDLKQEFGLTHYEGRGWRGFHHHASLSIAAYGFLLNERLSGHKPGSQKNRIRSQTPAIPEDYAPRGRPQSSTSCAGLDSDAAASAQRPARSTPTKMPGLRSSKTSLMTQ